MLRVERAPLLSSSNRELHASRRSAAMASTPSDAPTDDQEAERLTAKMQKLTPNVDGALQDTTWTWEDDLLYALPARTARKCARRDCPKTEPLEPPEDTAQRFAACAKCQTARYCSRECQRVHWRTGGHKARCKTLAMEGKTMHELWSEKLKQVEAIESSQKK